MKNLLDTNYFHPGIREANAGFTPGEQNADGSWSGSAGNPLGMAAVTLGMANAPPTF